MEIEAKNQSIIKCANLINLNYLHDDTSPGSCGYCKEDNIKKKTSYKSGFSCNLIHAEDYERLMFNGYRKCGTYYYKPNLSKSCCQQHTIRLDINEFEINHHQKKVMKKFMKYLTEDSSAINNKETDLNEEIENTGKIITEKINFPSNNDKMDIDIEKEINMMNKGATTSISTNNNNNVESEVESSKKLISEFIGNVFISNPVIIELLKLNDININLNEYLSKNESNGDINKECSNLKDTNNKEKIINDSKITNTISNYILYNKGKKCFSCNIFNSLLMKSLKQLSIKEHFDSNLENYMSCFISEDNIKNLKESVNTNDKSSLNSINKIIKDDFNNKITDIINKSTTTSNNTTNSDIIKSFNQVFQFKLENLFINFYYIKSKTDDNNKNKNDKDNDFTNKVKKDNSFKIKEENNSSNNINNVSNTIPKEELYILPYFDEIYKDHKIAKTKIKKKYRIVLDRADNSTEYWKEKYDLFKQYQISVHKDKESDLSEQRYLDSWGANSFYQTNYDKVNLDNNYDKENNLTNNLDLSALTHYGAYNILHFIDDKLIAVDVTDILPHSISSVYCYYDNDLSKKLSLGVVTAIREIEFTRLLKLRILNSQMKYYFMGYYIQTCQKMVYKGEYFPSQLLCPVTKNYVYLNDFVRKLIDTSKKGGRLFFNKRNTKINESKDTSSNTDSIISSNNNIITDSSISDSSNTNELVINEVSTLRAQEIMINSKLIYNDKNYNLLSFIERFIITNYQNKMIASLIDFIQNVGEKIAEESVLYELN